MVIGTSLIDFISLNHFSISPFDYEHLNAHDDFIPLMEKITTYDLLIIATPVYWYSMITQYKVFFDRFSDLLKIRKDLGRQLLKKKLFVVASFQSSYPKGLEDIFEQMCHYLSVRYLGTSFIYSGTENKEFLKNNAVRIAKAKKL